MPREVEIGKDRSGDGLVSITVAEGPFCMLSDKCQAARKAFLESLYKVIPWQITLSETAKVILRGKSDGV